VFVELAAEMGGTAESDWKLRGGHRFWTAPEAAHSYEPDNVAVTWKPLGENAAEIVQPPSVAFGHQKTLRLELLGNDLLRVSHRLTNTGAKPLTLTPWALSVMAPGGVALIPQPALDVHPSEFPAQRVPQPEDFLPNREMVLWPFTNLADGRYVFGEKFLRVSHHPELPATKIGLKLSAGWVAYQNGGTVFAKFVAHEPGAPYPDRGSNFELFTNPAILELETLAPLLPLAPGETREHVEFWMLHPTREDFRDEDAAKVFFGNLPTPA
jgi:uncharacterized protein YndB with AHSA1/START domain